MAIVAALAAIAVPRFGNSIARHRVEAAAARIAADLGLAQKRAVMTSTAQVVTFDPGSNSYTLKGAPHLDRAASAYVVDLGAEPYGAALATVDFGGDTEIVFNGYGLPLNGAGGSVVIQVGSHFRTVTVDSETGEASVE